MFALTRALSPVIPLLICTTALMAQHTKSLHPLDENKATEEIDSVLTELPKVDTPFAKVLIKSKSASLLWFSDPTRADTLFIETWKFAQEHDEPGFDRNRALNTLLRYLFPRNAKLAKQMLSEEMESETTAENGFLTPEGNKKLARLSSELIEVDPTAASMILERSLSQGITPVGMSALQRLREKDPLLSDYVVSRALEQMNLAPTVTSLAGLYVLSSYVFPESYTFTAASQFQSSLESLQFRYFSLAYDVLKKSILENETKDYKGVYTPNQLSVRSIHQAQMALILAVLSSRYQPSLMPELNSLASRLSVSLPAGVMQITQFTIARLGGQSARHESPELAIAVALAKGDFQEVDLLINRLKSEDQKKSFSQMLVKAQTRSALAGGHLEEALRLIRLVEDTDARLVFYIEACKAAHQKGDKRISTAVVGEARALIPQSDRNGLHVRALFSLAAQFVLMDSPDEGAELLNLAVVGLNALKDASISKPKTLLEAAWVELNDPQSFLTAPELEQAFRSLGSIDPDGALAAAGKIRDRSIRLVSRLEAIQTSTRRPAFSPKRPAAAAISPKQ